MRIMGARRRVEPDPPKGRLPIVEIPSDPGNYHRVTEEDGDYTCRCGATCIMYATMIHNMEEA
jgi:hypothetical protein